MLLFLQIWPCTNSLSLFSGSSPSRTRDLLGAQVQRALPRGREGGTPFGPVPPAPAAKVSKKPDVAWQGPVGGARQLAPRPPLDLKKKKY